VAGWLALGAVPAWAQVEAEPKVRQILMLQSFDRGNMTLDYFTGNFRVDLDQRTTTPVNVTQVVVGQTGFVTAPEQAVVAYIQSLFVDRPSPDLIVAVAGPATLFVRKYRKHLFPETPLLFTSVDQRFLDGAPLADNETAVSVASDFPATVELILQLLPRTKQVVMVMGSGQLGKFWRRILEVEFRRFHDRLTFVWPDDWSLPEILRYCASLPRDSAIFFFTFGTDASGAAYADERVLADLHAAASAPLFGAQSVYMGSGIVGGSLMPMGDISRSAAEVAVQILDGVKPARIRVPPHQPTQPTIDWRQLERWDIPESRLPPGSVVRYRTPSLWRTYRGTVLGALGVLVVQSLLIGGLVYERRARQRAELESRRNLALAADAGRRQTMSALTSSIAHELGQPLSSMIHNAQALQAMIAAKVAAPDTTAEILSDIRAQGLQATQIIDRHRAMLRSHQMEKKPVDLREVIRESLALVAHDVKTQQIEVAVNGPSTPGLVSGDQVLLQQVLVNLVINAMDAMAPKPPARRRLTIATDVREAEVELSVRDTGTGLPAQVDGRLFSPFVTTKPNGIGIGLTIVRTIIDAHGGTLDARNNPEGGATITVTLRRADTPGAPGQQGPA
jgi:signal transduction histidine kinase